MEDLRITLISICIVSRFLSCIGGMGPESGIRRAFPNSPFESLSLAVLNNFLLRFVHSFVLLESEVATLICTTSVNWLIDMEGHIVKLGSLSN